MPQMSLAECAEHGRGVEDAVSACTRSELAAQLLRLQSFRIRRPGLHSQKLTDMLNRWQATSATRLMRIDPSRLSARNTDIYIYIYQCRI